MFPIDVPQGLLQALVAFFVAFGFGFVLERAGFGDSRRLAAQFYFHEMRVLKVMFTAIVTSMLLLHLMIFVGWLDLGAIYVNPTHLVPGIVGGLIFGVGFVIGGYCPGTALVAAATGKKDGLFFVIGVFLGVFVFGEAYSPVRLFFETHTDWGTYRLSDLFGLDAGVVVLLVVLLALGMFKGGEILERLFAKNRPEGYGK